MGKKVIAALLLLSTPVWVEITMAPLLPMHGHHLHSAGKATAAPPSGHDHSKHVAEAATDACCPGHHSLPSDFAIVSAAGTPGCDDTHRCCFRQGPQNVPAIARFTEKPKSDSELASANILTPDCMSRACAFATNSFESSGPPPISGMVLRV